MGISDWSNSASAAKLAWGLRSKNVKHDSVAAGVKPRRQGPGGRRRESSLTLTAGVRKHWEVWTIQQNATQNLLRFCDLDSHQEEVKVPVYRLYSMFNMLAQCVCLWMCTFYGRVFHLQGYCFICQDHRNFNWKDESYTINRTSKYKYHCLSF